MGRPNFVDPAYADADTDELIRKFVARRTVMGELGCYLCGTIVNGDDGWHLEHIHPLGLHGVHQVPNLEISCVPCNLTKHNLLLDDFLGKEEADRWRACGWPPPFVGLTQKPVDELWAYNPKVARKFARLPRKVPIGRTEWGVQDERATPALDSKIALVLAQQSNPWRAMSIDELEATANVPGSGPLDQAWVVAMGLSTSPSKPGYLNIRHRPSRLVQPTRAVPTGGIMGKRAFRLRFRIDPRLLLDRLGGIASDSAFPLEAHPDQDEKL